MCEFLSRQSEHREERKKFTTHEVVIGWKMRKKSEKDFRRIQNVSFFSIKQNVKLWTKLLINSLPLVTLVARRQIVNSNSNAQLSHDKVFTSILYSFWNISFRF